MAGTPNNIMINAHIFELAYFIFAVLPQLKILRFHSNPPTQLLTLPQNAVGSEPIQVASSTPNVIVFPVLIAVKANAIISFAPGLDRYHLNSCRYEQVLDVEAWSTPINTTCELGSLPTQVTENVSCAENACPHDAMNSRSPNTHRCVAIPVELHS